MCYCLCMVLLSLYVLQLWKLGFVLSGVCMWQICIYYCPCCIEPHHIETELSMLLWILASPWKSIFFFFLSFWKLLNLLLFRLYSTLSMPHLLLWHSCHYNRTSALYSQHYYSTTLLFCGEIAFCPCVWPLKWSHSN